VQVLPWFLASFLLAGAPPAKHVRGRATVYAPGDGHCGARRADGITFRKQDNHIAHRTAPLGTAVLVCSHRTRRCVLTSVRDRGPFGAVRECGGLPHRTITWQRRCHHWRVMTRPLEGWTYRGVADLTRPVAAALGGHRAFDEVTLYFWPRSRTVDGGPNA